MSKFRDGLIGPTVILFGICFVMTLLLAFTYQTTEPVIAEVEWVRLEEAIVKVLPGAEEFGQIEGLALPEGVTEVYTADNGYVFKSGAKGFGGVVTYMIGMDLDGGITGIEMFDHEETPGLGTKVAEEDYLAGYLGQTDPAGVAAVTGATRTTNSLKDALRQAKEAYELVKGAA